jgi:hypothetical protein
MRRSQARRGFRQSKILESAGRPPSWGSKNVTGTEGKLMSGNEDMPHLHRNEQLGTVGISG